MNDKNMPNMSGPSKEVIEIEDDSTDFTDLMKQGFQALMPTIRASNSLPKGQQWDLFRTSSLFKPIMDSLGNKSLELMALILQHQGLHRDIRKRDLEEKYELVVETNDKILERVGTYLDELSGIRRNPAQTVSDVAMSPVNVASGSWNKDVTKSAVWKEAQSAKEIQSPVVLRNARVTQRPQVKFLDKIDNSNTPFEPRIKEKPNSLKPLAILLESLPNEDECYSHPYEFEIDRFQERIDSLNLTPRKVKLPRPLEETPLLTITQEDQLMDMLQELRLQTEIAVDLEHHSYRSFQGFTCLMQISTREKDFIIDTVELRHKLYVLNDVFTDPKIVKVFHGAESDVQWLQRDLSLYVVNMFDTYQAAYMLALPRHSLAFLLKAYCNVDANKTFQLYDWRTRPLAKEAIKYAREDTHYLLYIYDVLWNQLIQKSTGGTQMLQSVLYRSADTCKMRYWKFIFKDNSYESMYRKSRKNFDNRQMYAMKELYAWRDKIAREEDESTGYILPNHMLLLIAETLPKEMQGILACCNPIPPLVRQNLVLLHQIILKAREQPLVARVPTKLSSDNSRVRPMPQVTVNLEGALHCPHDLTHSVDFRDDLPTLLDNPHVQFNFNLGLLEENPAVNVFCDDGPKDCDRTKTNLPNQIHFMSPFERYKKMLVFMEAEENKTEEEKERQLQHDTQRLLDECMRERQRISQSTQNTFGEFAVKQENEGNPDTIRLGGHLEEIRNNIDREETAVNASIKTENSDEPFLKRKKNQKNNLSSNPQDESSITKNNPNQELSIKSEKDIKPEDDCSPRKKRKIQDIITTDGELSTGTKKKTATNKAGISRKNKVPANNFKQYDYSQVDYSQYQRFESNLQAKPSNSKFKHKGKKKQENKSFTFARKYGPGKSNKKS